MRKKMFFLLAVVIVAFTALGVALFINRTTEPESTQKTLPLRVHGIMVAYFETIGDKEGGENPSRRLWVIQEGIWKFDNCKSRE